MKKRILYLTMSALIALTGISAFSGCGKKEEKLGYAPRAEVRAKHFDVIDYEYMEPSLQITISALQGLIANKTDRQIYITHNEEPYYQQYQVWLDNLVKDHGVTATVQTNPWELIAKNKQHIKGYILFQMGTNSVNVATSYAGVRDALIIDRRHEGKMAELGIPRIMNVSGTNEKSFTKEVIQREGFSDKIAFEQNYVIGGFLRDYAVMSKGVVFWQGLYGDREIMMENLELETDGIIMGWGDAASEQSENPFIMATAEAGYHYLAADWALNYSVLSGFESKYKEYNWNAPTEITPEENVHYVTFYMSDGDNLQWNTGSRTNLTNWWGSPDRGNTQMTWGMVPSLQDIAPVVHDFYYETATPMDSFVIGSGDSFNFPSKMSKKQLAAYSKRIDDYMGRMNINIMSVLGWNSFVDAEDEMWNEFLKRDNIDGLIYFEWQPQQGLSRHGGLIRWVNDKPILTGRSHFFSKNYAEDEKRVLREINDEGSRDITKAGAYTVVYVHCWDGTDRLKEMKEIAAKFKDDVRVVNPDQMIKLIKNNVVR